jgi:hypothetical protein
MRTGRLGPAQGPGGSQHAFFVWQEAGATVV